MRYTLEYQTGTYQSKYGKKPEWRVFQNFDDKNRAIRAAKKGIPKGSRIRVYDNKLKKTVKTFGDFMESKEDYIRQIIRELIDDELDEMTTTASAGPYNTPYAFTGKKKQNEKKRKSTATQAGYELSDESGEEEDNTIFEARIDQGSKVKVIRGARKGQTGVVKAVVKGKQITPLTYGQHFRVEFDDGRIQDYQEKSLRLVEGGDPYYAWRNDETATPRQKIGRAISEVNKSLTELNKTLRRCARLKKETGLSAGQDYWKRTNKALLKIEQKAHKMAQRIRQMRV